MTDTATATPPATAPTAPAASTDPKVKTLTPAASAPAASGDQKATVATPDGKVEVTKEANPDDPTKPYVVKIDGQDVAMSLDELKTYAQKGKAADKRFQEASALSKQAKQEKAMANEFFRLLKADPEAILTNPKIGINLKELAEKYLAKQYELEMMDPKDRELHDTKAKLAAAEEEKRLAAKKTEDQQLTELTQRYNEQYEKDIVSALATADLPKTRWTVRQMAYYMHQGLQSGVELKAADVVDFVRTDYHRDLGDILGNLDGDKLAALMGDANIKKLNEAILKKVRPGNTAPASSSAGGDPEPAANGEAKKLSKEEWRKKLDEKVKALS